MRKVDFTHLEEILRSFLAEDNRFWDVTSEIVPDTAAIGIIKAKCNGIVAGAPFAVQIFEMLGAKAHIITPIHRVLDEQIELMKGKNKIGSTKKGIGPTYTDKYARIGIRVEDILSRTTANKKYQKLLRIHSNVITEKLKQTLEHCCWKKKD